MVYLLYTPQLGIKPVAFWCTGWYSDQLSHVARAENTVFDLRFVESVSGKSAIQRADCMFIEKEPYISGPV